MATSTKLSLYPIQVRLVPADSLLHEFFTQSWRQRCSLLTGHWEQGLKSWGQLEGHVVSTHFVSTHRIRNLTLDFMGKPTCEGAAQEHLSCLGHSDNMGLT